MEWHILLAESRNVYRTGLRTIFSCDPHVASIIEVTTSEDLTNKLASDSVDFVVVHQSLITDICLLPKNRFLILATDPIICMFLSACAHGACGYFLEDASENLLRMSLHLPPGKCLLDPTLTSWLQPYIVSDVASPLDLSILTPREREVFALYESGLSNSEIAARLSNTKATVKKHRENISRKLKMKLR